MNHTTPRSPAWFRNARRVMRAFGFLGFDPRRFLRNMIGIPGFIRDLSLYFRKSPPPMFRIRFADLFPILDERSDAAGAVGGHYFHQDLWAARKICLKHP